MATTDRPTKLEPEMITPGGTVSKLASRKFLVTVGMFFGSIMVVLVKPDLLGDGNAMTLFNFWTMLLAVFAGGNIGEHIVKGKK